MTRPLPRPVSRPAPRYAWHADRYDPSLASIRYRLFDPMAALQRQGIAIERFDTARAAAYDAIIFSKSHTPEAVAIARAAKAAGQRVIMDLCDNLYAAHRIGHASAGRIARMTEMLQMADRITFATAALAGQIAKEVPGLAAPTAVVPDTLDVEPPTPARLSLRERIALGSLRRFHARHAGALQCVWFGKSLGQASGYAHIGAAVERLARFGEAHPVTLTIVSNAWWKYRRARGAWPVATHYMPWTLATVQQVLAMHRVAIVPVERNDYTAGKTINRPASAVLAGLGVVADAIPSYEELRPYIALDDWEGGLARYLEWSPDTQATLAAGRAHLAARYSPDAVAAVWRDILEP